MKPEELLTAADDSSIGFELRDAHILKKDVHSWEILFLWIQVPN